MATDKHARTIRLDIDVHSRLVALCKHLGVTPNSYILSAVGKAVSTDELVFKTQEKQAEMFDKLELLMTESSADEG